VPVHAYRCARCGLTADVLVRGREPLSCDEAPAFRCALADSEPGALVRLVSAAHVGSASGSAARRDVPARSGEGCDHCGMTPGSCETPE
jgi:hypothetical protein